MGKVGLGSKLELVGQQGPCLNAGSGEQSGRLPPPCCCSSFLCHGAFTVGLSLAENVRLQVFRESYVFEALNIYGLSINRGFQEIVTFQNNTIRKILWS